MNYRALLPLLLLLLTLAGCNAPSQASRAAAQPFVISAIPDQDPEKLQRLYGKIAGYLQQELGVPVTYKPVTDYTASVTGFKVGDLDMVWYGGLTGVQARAQVKDTLALAQRDIDEQFRSVFIVNKSAGVKPITDVKDLAVLKGRTFTFGSDTSTSGRLMPQYFLKQAGVALTDFKGEPGFSGSHDKTIKLVEAGTYEAGVLNEQVWEARLKSGEVDTSKVEVILRSPPFYDYHWALHPQVKARYGQDFPDKIVQALTKLDPANPAHKEILDLFGAQKFIPTKNSNYDGIEAIAREIGKLQ